MTSGYRKLLISGLILAVIVLGAVFGIMQYLAGSAKQHFEHAAGARLGMRVSSGSLHLSLLPPAISIRDVRVEKHDVKIGRIAELRVRLDLFALFRRQMQIVALKLTKPELEFRFPDDSGWNILIPEPEKKGSGRVFLPETLDIRNGSFSIRTPEHHLELLNVGLTLQDIVLAEKNKQDLWSRLMLSGDFRSDEFKWNNLRIRNIRSHLRTGEGSLDLKPLTFRTLEGSGTGKVKVNLDAAHKTGSMHLELSGLRTEDLFSSFAKEKLLRGEVDLVVDLTAGGATSRDILRSITGSTAMTGSDLTLTRLDLDKLLEEYMQTQRFNLVDLGAYAVLGPWGPTLTRIYNFSGVLNASHDGSTEIRQLVSRWNIDKGTAVSRDVAIATPENRIAVQGKIDFVAGSFRNLVVGVVDDKGCVLVRQEMNGPFDDPEIKKPNFIETAAAPLINILKGTADLLIQSECEVFYSGSVAAPDD